MARDIIHQVVKNALVKDGWLITNDPVYLESGGVSVEVDLAAEKFIVADKGIDHILVEIKSMNRKSLMYDFHSALGQYLDYRGIVEDENIDRHVYLAIPQRAYQLMQTMPFYDKRLKQFNVSLIIVDILNEIIVKWIK